MTQETNIPKKKYDLEERTKIFAKNVRGFLQRSRINLTNSEDAKQLIRSSGSVGANYIEANEALSKKDFVYRIYVCRKESKETAFWLDILIVPKEYDIERQRLFQEAIELLKIFNAIIEKSK